MVGRKKRKDEESENSSSDDEVLSKIKKKSGGKKNGSRSNSKRSSSKAKAKANKPSDEESESDSANSEVEVKKSKERSRSNKKTPAAPTNRPKRGAEPSKESSRKRSVSRSEESSEEEADANENGENESPSNRSPEKRPSKKRAIQPKKAKEEKKEKDEEYEIEEILDFKIEDKMKYFLVRWKGYDSSADSWVYRRDLHCLGLIEQFYAKRPEARVTTQKRKKKDDFTASKKKKKTIRQPPGLKIDEQPDYDPEAYDENQEWKVDRIIDVRFRRDKKRDFLIRWEGFSWRCDSWEPEENLDCGDLINKFMAKLEDIANASVKELRPVRKPTQRYTLMDVTKGRRLSKRLDGRQRAAYYDCEE